MEKIFEVAKEAALQAGHFIQSNVSGVDQLQIEQKSLNDFVSEVDRGSENIIRELITQAFPCHSILGEEYGTSYGGRQYAEHNDPESDYKWIVDPLDGTTNFLRGIPHYAVSIAVTYKSKPVVGVVYDPVKEELFSAIVDKGAQLNGKSILCRDLPTLQGSLLATGVPFSGPLLDNLGLFTRSLSDLLSQHTSGVRRLGAAALDLAYVAAGRYDGFWEAQLHPWDVAAGALIVREAGGIVSDFNNENTFLETGNIVAANADMHSAMVRIVGQAYQEWSE